MALVAALAAAAVPAGALDPPEKPVRVVGGLGCRSPSPLRYAARTGQRGDYFLLSPLANVASALIHRHGSGNAGRRSMQWCRFR